MFDIGHVFFGHSLLIMEIKIMRNSQWVVKFSLSSLWRRTPSFILEAATMVLIGAGSGSVGDANIFPFLKRSKYNVPNTIFRKPRL